MFGGIKAFSGFSVDDLAAAEGFYGGTLEVDTEVVDGLLFLHLAGGNDVIVYPKADHRPASFTILNFPVEDIDEAVAELLARGVRFERYPQFAADTDDRGVVRGNGGPPIAWFKDPAGNVLSVLEEM